MTEPLDEYGGRSDVIIEPVDFPFQDVVVEAEKMAQAGFKVFQKFTCGKCGQRLAVDIPNHFYESADCDQCGFVTNIKEKGCNYLLVKHF